ncbi:hypothetical protein NBO_10g0068 [Nosema bombycis CQ1]|uniref:Uncharacterized protein n=1 Tax=Nosema bombycis (strain CQ1 / CVCC 102059) TaxID=578461 RepID=R0MQB6_NOSB1|nr:hypothetical protein NBO_10g0068 [Nosema bombycis CQ1]|eukprot:EOB15078.1 hypothetical protein NBO_10g0068 [Nosema bombycis CQ1]
MAKQTNKDFDKYRKLKRKFKKLQETNVLLKLQIKKIENFYLNKINFYKKQFNEEKEGFYSDYESLMAKYLNLITKK